MDDLPRGYLLTTYHHTWFLVSRTIIFYQSSVRNLFMSVSGSTGKGKRERKRG
jgi:hypothetical protein